MTGARVIPSTTSHKREPVAAVLDLFARLGWLDIDLNLWPFMEEGEAIETAVDALARNGQRAGMVSGGWCDFFETGPPATTTRASVARQAGYARRLGATHLRLFYGRLPAGEYTRACLVAARDHLRDVADEHPDLMLVVENHGRGASGRMETCAEILAAVDRPNVRMNFDPINAEHAGTPAMQALDAARPFVAHVHLKGLARPEEYCEFGAGIVDLTPVIDSLLSSGYQGRFTVEYEGPHDKTLRLWLGYQAAMKLIRAR